MEGTVIDERGTMIGAVFAGQSSLMKCLPRSCFDDARDDRDDVF